MQLKIGFILVAKSAALTNYIQICTEINITSRAECLQLFDAVEMYMDGEMFCAVVAAAADGWLLSIVVVRVHSRAVAQFTNEIETCDRTVTHFK